MVSGLSMFMIDPYSPYLFFVHFAAAWFAILIWGGEHLRSKDGRCSESLLEILFFMIKRMYQRNYVDVLDNQLVWWWAFSPSLGEMIKDVVQFFWSHGLSYIHWRSYIPWWDLGFFNDGICSPDWEGSNAIEPELGLTGIGFPKATYSLKSKKIDGVRKVEWWKLSTIVSAGKMIRLNNDLGCFYVCT